MLKFFQEWKEKKALGSQRKEFYAEMKKNLESFYVMDQLGKLRFFKLEICEKLKKVDLHFPESVLTYFQSLQNYNDSLQDFKDYEQWYTTDINQKTPDNAKALHEKKEQAQNQFSGLEKIIKSAIKDWEARLKEMGLLKKT